MTVRQKMKLSTMTATIEGHCASSDFNQVGEVKGACISLQEGCTQASAK